MAHRLIIGGGGSIWLLEYIRNIEYPQINKTTVIAFEKWDEAWEKQYTDLGVKVQYIGKETATSISSKYNGLIQKCKLGLEFARKLLTTLHFALAHGIKKDIDYVEVHQPPNSFQASLIVFLLKCLQARTLVNFWGSDILRLKDSRVNQVGKIIAKGDVLNIATDEMYRKFLEVFPKYKGKKRIRAIFGSLALPYIDACKKFNSANSCKIKMGFNPSKIQIAIGYNGAKEQQHLEIIKGMKGLEDQYKGKIQVVLHIGSEFDERYLQTIVDSLDRGKFDYIVLDRNYSLKDIGLLRNAVDVFIHGQTTDALSSTMREYIYAGAIVLNGNWLRYQELEDIGAEYFTFNEFEELNGIIKTYMDGNLKVNTEKNRKVISDNFSWEHVEENWMEWL